MFKAELDGYSKAFVFGTGGGNDIVSSVLIALYMQQHGIQTNIGGVLSPGAVHKFDGNLENVVNEIKGPVTRHIDCRNPIPISFIDGFLPSFAKDLGISKFYDLSLRYGTSALVEGVNELAASNNYDLIVAVDMGGDILARYEDPTILSPAMDFTSLHLLGQVDTDSILIEFGLGTDGELRPKGMQEILEDLTSRNLIHNEYLINPNDLEVTLFDQLFDKIKRIRTGHATEMTQNTFKADETITSEYRFISQVGKKQWTTSFKLVLPAEYFRKVYSINGKALSKLRPNVKGYENLLELYVQLKNTPSWKTELDLLYIWSGKNWATTEQEGNCLMLLAPSTRLSDEHRSEIIDEGIIQIMRDMCDAALVRKEDLVYIPQDIYQADADKFVVLTTEKNMQSFIRTTADQIKEYQRA